MPEAADAEIVLHTHPMSRGRIARWMLEETGAPYRVVVHDYGPTMKGAAYLAINPMGKVPALEHGGTVVTETAAICAHLADAFPEAGLAPAPGSAARGSYYRWLFFGAGPVEAATTNAAMGFDLGPDPRRQGMAGYGSLDAVLDTIEGAVAGREYLLDEGFSAADLYLGAQLFWGMEVGTIPRRESFGRYWAGLAARPAHRRATALDDALMPAHPVPGM